MIDDDVVKICPACDGFGIIDEEDCVYPDCVEGILKTKEEIIEELDKEKNVSRN